MDSSNLTMKHNLSSASNLYSAVKPFSKPKPAPESEPPLVDYMFFLNRMIASGELTLSMLEAALGAEHDHFDSWDLDKVRTDAHNKVTNQALSRKLHTPWKHVPGGRRKEFRPYLFQKLSFH